MSSAHFVHFVTNIEGKTLGLTFDTQSTPDSGAILKVLLTKLAPVHQRSLDFAHFFHLCYAAFIRRPRCVAEDVPREVEALAHFSWGTWTQTGVLERPFTQLRGDVHLYYSSS